MVEGAGGAPDVCACAVNAVSRPAASQRGGGRGRVRVRPGAGRLTLGPVAAPTREHQSAPAACRQGPPACWWCRQGTHAAALAACRLLRAQAAASSGARWARHHRVQETAHCVVHSSGRTHSTRGARPAGVRSASSLEQPNPCEIRQPPRRSPPETRQPGRTLRSRKHCTTHHCKGAPSPRTNEGCRRQRESVEVCDGCGVD